MRLLLPAIFLICTGCEEGSAPLPANVISSTPSVNRSSNDIPPVSAQEQTQFTVGDKRYLFDVTNHSIEDLEALLQRTEEIIKENPQDIADLKIVMILHGPDLDWFTRENYKQHSKMVDQAARLDALDIIDIKACTTTMEIKGINPDELPGFIETVPYAPDEIARLKTMDYISL